MKKAMAIPDHRPNTIKKNRGKPASIFYPMKREELLQMASFNYHY
jgi:hypothetical protein